MNTFFSNIREIGPIAIPRWRGVRVQLMPVLMNDPDSLPSILADWKQAAQKLFNVSTTKTGVGYLTIDQRFVPSGTTHRRPGLHVDGAGAWGKGTWGINGMLMASTVNGCVAWRQEFTGKPIAGTDPGDPDEGCCEHLRPQLRENARVFLAPYTLYECEALCVHESIPCEEDCYRTFVRLSMPSDSAWPANCTPNPLGIKPGGPIAEPRRVAGQYSY